MSSQSQPNAGQPLLSLRRAIDIFTISVCGLFLELMLIRWIGTEVRIFAYLQNTVLIVCFLGLGMGCFTSHRPASLRNLLLALAGLTVLLALPPTRAILANITNLLSVLDDLLIWERSNYEGLPATIARVVAGLTLTLGLMVLVFEMFVPIGRLLGRLMDTRAQVIRAYSINVAGSLLGIWLFVALSAWSLPPIVWLLVACVLLLPFVWVSSESRLVNLALVAVLLVAGVFVGREPLALETHWSPYQKLVLKPADPEHYGWDGRLITVNNAGYQAMIDLDRERVAANPRIAAALNGLSQYDLPLRFKRNPQQVLIVGAGSGNDAAGALRGGAEQVTAVEIDPAIIDMGRRHHPERPYDSPHVKIVNDDARSFFATTAERYDLIIFGLLDSHTTTAMTNARLDHYVYTRESLLRARQLLAPEGVMVLSFEALKPYIADRMANCLREVFGQEPLAFRIRANTTGWGGVMFVAGDSNGIERAIAADPALASYIARCQAESPLNLTYQTAAATDDWPYIYLEQPRIPTLYYLLAGLMSMLLWYGKRRLEIPLVGGDWQRSDAHFFLLGAAFLLLEVQNISKASVVLGNTWVVNAVIISAILLMILLANCLVARFGNFPRPAVFTLLVTTCLGIYWIDLSTFAFLAYPLKALLVGGLTTLPMLFAGMIFIDSFDRTDDKARALGANLIGSLVGGMLQSLTFVIGIKALLLLVAVSYLGAWLTRPTPETRTAPLGGDDLDGQPLLGRAKLADVPSKMGPIASPA
ncbi:MAG: methyltransferase domain-containing protein [Pirellulales bacterium]|nr:methyltransferase domain-containing protein [Pirellulales bacterium]